MSNYIRSLALATTVACLSLSAQAISTPIILNFNAEGVASKLDATNGGTGTVAVKAVNGLQYSGNVRGRDSSLNPDLLPAAWGGYLLGSNNFTITVLAGFVFDSVALDYAVGDPNGMTWSLHGVNGGSNSHNLSGSQTDPWPHRSDSLALAGDTIDSISFLTSSTGYFFGIDNLRISLSAALPPTPTPEPAALGLVALALAGLTATSRRRKL